MTRLLLIRHGESQANRGSFFAGQKDVPLEEKGLSQARVTADFIVHNYSVDKIYASDLCRAYDTGKAVADLLGLEVIPDPRLREIYAGQWQGQKFTDIIDGFSTDYQIWLKDIGNCVCTGGESVAQLGSRVLEALTDIARTNPGKTVVIATHATPIRVLQCLLNGQSLDHMKDIPWTSNASVTEITYESGLWNLEKIGYDRHLSALKTSFSANV